MKSTTRRRKDISVEPVEEVVDAHVDVVESASPTIVSRGIDAKAFDDWVSVSLDVFKGVFIIFMLTEHTRSALAMSMGPGERIMQFVSQMACSLDMTCFSTAYGFSCYRAYLTNSKKRSAKEQWLRVFRSVGLIYAAAVLSNISYEMAVLKNPPTLKAIWSLVSLDLLYWDFLMTFPFLLLIGYVTTKPLLSFVSRPRKGQAFIRLVVFAFLLIWPMVASLYPLDKCPDTSSRYKALFLGCIRRSFGAMRFSVLTYMFYFNFGCIVSMLLLELKDGGQVSSSTKKTDEKTNTPPTTICLPSLKQALCSPVAVGFLVLLCSEIYYAIPLLKEYNRSWEYLRWNGYRRFPMSWPVILAWGLLSQLVLAASFLGVALVRADVCGVIGKRCHRAVVWLASKKIEILAHFGANVLLYLLVSNIVIHGFFHVDWEQYFLDKTGEQQSSVKKGKKQASPPMYTIGEWEWVVVFVALGQILLVQLIRYLVTSSRK